jgi:outer membrane protein
MIIGGKTMKKILLIGALLLMAWLPGFSQKYAFVDTDYIMNNIPEYTDAQAMLDDLSVEWQKEIETKFAEIDKMYKDYQAESILLPEDLKKQKENEIIQKEKEAKDLQKKRFGKDGDLYKKRLELVQPIQEKIFNAIQDMAVTRNYAFIFDKASGATLLYADSKLDLSDDVLDEIGTVMQTVKRESRTRQTVQLGVNKNSNIPSTGQMAPQSRQGTTGTTNTGQKDYNSGSMDQGKEPMPPPPGEKKK